MAREIALRERIREIRSRDARYAATAYEFTLEGLEFTLKKIGQRRHVSGPELLHGIREYALKKFGFLARSVLQTWGVRRTDDFGEMVFNMVEAGLMGKTDQDRKDDFQNIYDFKEAFDDSFQMEGRWKTPA